MTRGRAAATLLATAAAVVLLAGCASGDPAPAAPIGATPRPTAALAVDTTSVPVSEEGAIAAAEATLTAYLRAYDQIVIDGSTSTDGLGQLAAGAAWAGAVSGLQQIVGERRTQTGYATFDADGAAIAPDDGGLPFGAVEIQGCFDPSARHQLLADGTAAPLPDPVRSVKTASVAFVPQDGRWLVTYFGDPAAGVVGC